jgi:simple sugar transport system permease protein
MTRRVLLAMGGALLMLSVVRVLTGADDLTSSGTFGAALRLAVPIGLVGLGALYAERVGVANIGLEGMMILGTWFGAWGGWMFGPWEGVALGLIGGALGGLVHAVATVTFTVDHIISGVVINILGAAVARYLSISVFEGQETSSATQSPPIQGHLPHFDVPLLASGPDLLGRLEDLHVFLISDLAGVLGGLTRDLSVLTVIAVALVPFTAWFLWRTPIGLRLRSAGEQPTAAETLGVNVYRMKYAGVIVSGALAGLGGAFLVIEQAGLYREGQTAGRGFIGLATVIFGNWRPGGVASGAALFGYADGLQLRNAQDVHSLLLVISMALACAAAWYMLRGTRRSSVITGVIASGFLVWFLLSDRIPSQFLFFTPQVITLAVLALASQRLRPPAAVGLPYRRGAGT